MPWARLDDSFYDHLKLDLLGDDRLPAVGLFTVALSWSSKHLSEGLIPANRVVLLGGNADLAGALVRVGLWEQDGPNYRIHDYLDYNPSTGRGRHQRIA
jgi:hypothetical protein